MPPKVRITREDIVDAAVDIVRKEGAEMLNARNVALALGCSTQPVFSNFSRMEDLRFAVVERADLMCRQYMAQETQKGEYPAYKAAGMAYIRFAKEEKELFKLLYMRDRGVENTEFESDITHKMESVVNNNTGLKGDEARLFHLEMWAYVHGIAAMFATGFLDLDWELVSRMLTDSYQGLVKRHKE